MNTTEEKYSDNISSASEASESTGSGKYSLVPMGLSNVFDTGSHITQTSLELAL
jgi:hypothetical protein